MVTFKNKLFKFECDICPTDRNCRQCRRYKDRIKCPVERRWYYGNDYTLVNRWKVSIILIILIIPVFFIFGFIFIIDRISRLIKGESLFNGC